MDREGGYFLAALCVPGQKRCGPYLAAMIEER